MNTFGTIFRLSVFGESHGPAIGVVIDGVPPGIPVSEEDFMEDLSRRMPGSGRVGVTTRSESDLPKILSGVFDGCATGAPITIMFENENQRSGDYARFSEVPRPGHADYTASVKYNYFNDIRGGGHFSGRMTLALVAAGVIAKKVIFELSDAVAEASVLSIGGLTGDDALEMTRRCASEGDSVGAVVECVVRGVRAGYGEPFFDSLESVISHLVFSIPGIRGIEFGDGFAAAAMRGSEHNDPFVDSDGHTSKNGSGGINGGISNGNELVFRVAVKPASSISVKQRTCNMVTGEIEDLVVGGRHDSCIALRVPPVLEAVAAIALADAMLRQK